MVYITDEATTILDEIRNQALEQMENLPTDIPEPGLRLLIQKDQAALSLDVPQTEDQVVERDGHPVLLIDSQVGNLLSGATVDIEHAPTGDRLVIERREGEGEADETEE